ncbi:ATP-binding protein, partial [Alicyclobacillus suci]|uniref:ATP-binding protein n=1 Tax=Alicyclobacillus suci TaxID=2816080 RepID=UPI001F3A03DF
TALSITNSCVRPPKLVLPFYWGWEFTQNILHPLLFTHLSLRAGRKSTMITTNLSFERWSEIFQDPVMTAAMIDRLTHQSYTINMNGNSFRMKETKEWLEKQNLA